MKIALYDAKGYDRESFNIGNQEFGYKIKYFEAKLTEDTTILAKGYDVVCAFVNDAVSETVINQLYELGIRLLALRCAGYNNVDFKSAYGKVHIVRVPAYSPYAVAEHALALMTALNRKTHRAYNRTRENNFNITGFTGFDFYGKTVGVIGTGKIGRIFINICLGLGMKVMAYDLYPSEIDSVEFVDLETLYKHADIISLHCPLTKETEHLINKDAIQLMKDSVMLINTSRGGLVNTEDLIEGLKNRKIASAGLDVYEEESEYFFEDFSSNVISDDVLARLLSFTNVLVTSHQAFLTKEALHNIAMTTLNNIKEYKENKALTNEICYQCPDRVGTCHKETTGRCFK
jgi:D-lactate dehydrogenase